MLSLLHGPNVSSIRDYWKNQYGCIHKNIKAYILNIEKYSFYKFYWPLFKSLVKAIVFLVVMYGCKRWTVKKAEHQRIDAFELWCWRTLEIPLDCKEIQLINPKGKKSWIFIGRIDAQAEALILWSPDAKNWLIGKDPHAWKDWRQEEKGLTEDEMDGWVASVTQWTWMWANSGRWWRTRKPGMLQSIESQRVGTT